MKGKQRLTLKERKSGLPTGDTKGVLNYPLFFAYIYTDIYTYMFTFLMFIRYNNYINIYLYVYMSYH